MLTEVDPSHSRFLSDNKLISRKFLLFCLCGRRWPLTFVPKNYLIYNSRYSVLSNCQWWCNTW